MAYVNKVILLAKVLREVEFSVKPDGTPIAVLVAGTQEHFKPTDSNDMDLHRIVVEGSKAEYVRNFINEGFQIYAEGRQKFRKTEIGILPEVLVDDFGMIMVNAARKSKRTTDSARPSHSPAPSLVSVSSHVPPNEHTFVHPAAEKYNSDQVGDEYGQMPSLTPAGEYQRQ